MQTLRKHAVIEFVHPKWELARWQIKRSPKFLRRPTVVEKRTEAAAIIGSAAKATSGAVVTRLDVKTICEP